jgi:hypothetical protein
MTIHNYHFFLHTKCGSAKTLRVFFMRLDFGRMWEQDLHWLEAAHGEDTDIIRAELNRREMLNE